MDNSKTCTKCRQIKPLEAFGISKVSKDGISYRCKQCVNQLAREYRLANPDSSRETVRRYYANHPERIKEIRKKSHEADPSKRKLRAKRYRENNPETIRARKKRWDVANPEKNREYNNSRRARIRANGVFVIKQKELNRLYASSCFYCGSYDKIEADHIVPLSRGGRHSIGNLVPACRSCNASKKSRFISEWRLWKAKLND